MLRYTKSWVRLFPYRCDVEASKVFYQNVFGVSDLKVEEGIVALELPNLSLFFIEEQEFEFYSKKSGRGVQYADANVGVILSCAIETQKVVDSILRMVPHYGGTVPQDAGIDDALGIYLGHFFDPDGHYWELAVPDHRAIADS